MNIALVVVMLRAIDNAGVTILIQLFRLTNDGPLQCIFQSGYMGFPL